MKITWADNDRYYATITKPSGEFITTIGADLYKVLNRMQELVTINDWRLID